MKIAFHGHFPQGKGQDREDHERGQTNGVPLKGAPEGETKELNREQKDGKTPTASAEL